MIPRVTRLFGRTGGKAGQGRAAQEDTDTLQSKAYASMIDLLGEGPLEGFCTSSGITIVDALLLKQPEIINGVFQFNTTNFVQELDEVWTGIKDASGNVSPLINQDSQGYPFDVARYIKAVIFNLTDNAPTTNADIRVIVYPRTEEEKTEYLNQARLVSIASDDPSAWSAFSDSLKIYPEGKVRGIYIYDGGKDYVADSFVVMVPKATLSAVLFDGVPALDEVDLSPRYQDIGLQYRLGYEDQAVMPGFDNVQTVIEPSNSVEIKYSDTWGNLDDNQPPWTWQSETLVDYDRLVVDISLINGLFYQDTKLGDIKAVTDPTIQIYMKHDRGHVAVAGEVYYDDSNVKQTAVGGEIVWISAGILGRGLYDLQGKTMSAYEKSLEVKLNKPNDTDMFYWRVKVWRRTKDDPDLNLQYGDRKYSTAFKVSRITAISDQQFTYPFSALVGIRINAEQFNKIPVRSYRMKLLRCFVPDNYFPPYSLKIVKDADGNEISRSIRQFAEYCRDATTGEGVYDSAGNPIEQEWTGLFYTSWTNNPAWISFNACLNDRWGLGRVMPPPNKWWHYKIGRYCDEYGPFNGASGPIESRFTANVVFQKKAEAFKAISDLASIFAGYYYYSSGTVVPVQDAPKKVRSSFAPANVTDGLFLYKGSQRKLRHTVAVIMYNEPTSNYALVPAYYEDPEGIARYGYQPLNQTAFGCTSIGQARRLGKRLIRQELSNTDTVAFTTGLQGSILRPGNLFSVYDPTRSSLPFGGRVLEILYKPLSDGGDGLPWIVLDRVISDAALLKAAKLSSIDDLKPTEFSIVFTRSVGEVDATEIASAADIDALMKAQLTDPIPLSVFETNADGKRMVKLIKPLPDGVNVGTMWGLRHTNVQPQFFTLLGVEETAKHEFAVNGIEYHEALYGEVFEDADYWEQPINPNLDYWKRPGVPRNLLLKLITKREQGFVSYTLAIAWSSPEFGWAKAYEVHIKKNLGNFQYVTTTKDTHVDLPLSEPDSYTVRVYSVGITNILSEYAEANIGYLSGENQEMISGLEVAGQSNDNKFYYGDLKIAWRVNWSQADSTLHTSTAPVLPGTIDAYILNVYDANSVLLKSYDLGSTEWLLSLVDNKLLTGGPYRDLIIEVKARTNDLKLSVPTLIRVSNLSPDVMTGSDIAVTTNALGQFSIAFLRGVQKDFAGYRVWASLISGFTPDQSSLIWEGSSNQTSGLIVAGATNPDVIYYRVAEFDLLSNSISDCNISDEFNVTVNKTV